jgi:hypothetical protein
MKWIWVLALAAPAPDEPEAVVFFSPTSPDASELIRSFGIPVKAVLLVESYATGLEPSEAFLATVRAAGPVAAADVDGLALARRLGIRELPAAALRRGSRWHVAAGTAVDGKELLRCSR